MKTQQLKKTTPNPKRKLALLIAAHNEEMVIAQTIRSAIRAGIQRQYIYVVDDNSSDATSKIVKEILGKENVLRVRRSGKGLALTKATKKFKLVEKYQWIHIADADGGFARDYFAVFRRELNPKYAAATGYVRSLPGGMISQYRVVEYTLGMEIQRRFQAATHTVTVIPGPTSCFRYDVFTKLNFANQSLTEDFDVTLQLHRQKLGSIQFIPGAVAYTQDPLTFKDFIKQITRWNRGIMQGLVRHNIGRRLNRIDAYLSYQVFQNFLFFVNYFVILPILAFSRDPSEVIARTFLFDVIITLGIVFAVAIKTRRWDIISAYPFIYALRWVSLYVFLRAFFDVVIRRKFLLSEGIWATGARRYKSTIELVTAAVNPH